MRSARRFSATSSETKSRVIGEPVMDSLSQLCGQGSTRILSDVRLHGRSRDGASCSRPSRRRRTSRKLQRVAARVTISWTASASPSVTYHVFKTTSLQLPNYTEVTCAAPPSTTSCVEAGAHERQPAYYYVIATDSLGYDSRWSNFNSDCAVNGPDCLEGVPLNPILRPRPPDSPDGRRDERKAHPLLDGQRRARSCLLHDPLRHRVQQLHGARPQ